MHKTISRVTDELISQSIDELELLKWEHGVETFHIVECFNNHEVKSIDVKYLCADYEHGIIFCYDDGGVLCDNECVSMGFLKKSIKSVDIDVVNGVEYDRINLTDGYIIINAVK